MQQLLDQSLHRRRLTISEPSKFGSNTQDATTCEFKLQSTCYPLTQVRLADYRSNACCRTLAQLQRHRRIYSPHAPLKRNPQQLLRFLKPLPFRGGVGVGTVGSRATLQTYSVSTPSILCRTSALVTCDHAVAELCQFRITRSWSLAGSSCVSPSTSTDQLGATGQAKSAIDQPMTSCRRNLAPSS